MVHGLETMHALNKKAVANTGRKRTASNGNYILDKGGYRSTRTSEPLGLRVDLSSSDLRKPNSYSANGSSEVIPAFSKSKKVRSVDSVTEAALMEARAHENGTKSVVYSNRNSSEMIPLHLLEKPTQVHYGGKSKY